jgi:outer membrane PBP1 activator LpoA protein
MFVDMPWVLAPDGNAALLQAALQKYGQENMKKYNRYYALGIDAYYLLSRLQQLSSHQWQGQTGHLSVNKSGIIHRDQLRWARFVEGNPQLITDN